ncbi:hypothetical protein ASG51_13860 [Methylobacterium sp. Leaf465]|nr:hypothetical protein ASF20_07425 [Methylobacterium sp. Leaf88]KQT70151.1 hypothetical protein ASG51_13860 [Methylobacterium sp. Leaf465]KQU34032.1 hypothetical protein ASG63_13400 [Methylobacterium sp. Leaf94]
MSTKMNHSHDAFVSDEGPERRRIRKVHTFHAKIGKFFQSPGPRLFQRNGIVIVKYIDSDYAFSAFKQSLGDMISYEACGSTDDDWIGSDWHYALIIVSYRVDIGAKQL